MSVIRVGSSSTYATGWDAVFGGGTSRRSTVKKPRATVKPKAAKRPAKKAKKAKKSTRR